MDAKPYRFVWPDPLAPRFITRDLTVLRGEEKGKKRKRKPPLPLCGVRLIELVPHCLYEVPIDCHDLAKGVDELRAGSILSRNMKLSERLNGGSVEGEVQQHFQSLDGVYMARRGLGGIDRRYRSREIPANRKLAGTLDEMVKRSWELHLVDEEEREAFVLVAVQAAEEYGRPVDEDKVAAQERTLQAGNPFDTKGRHNPGRIPLICFAGERRIAKRIHAVRGKGRRMSFREAVVEHYIDRLCEIARDVSRSQRHRLREAWLTGKERTPVRVRREADRLEGAARRLRAIVSRPFSRSFTHCANDLNEAARLLRVAAKERRGDEVAQAKEVIGRVYRAMIQMECHWRIEDILLQASILEDRNQELGASQRKMWHEELRAVHRRLTSVDALTGKRLEDGFRRQVLPRVFPHVQLADIHLMQDDPDRGSDLATMREELRKAVEPL